MVSKGAEQGFVNAQFNLGLLYAKGEGVPTDATEALKWFRKAADQGDAEAQYGIGVMYAQGEGVIKDTAEAAKWVRKASEQGNTFAQLTLAVMYHQGEGVPKDEIEALAWITLAANGGDKDAGPMRVSLEQHLGQDATLAGQQRSKELLKQIEAARGKTASPATGK